MPPRILIVDDNPTNLRLATDILEDAGCRIDQAGDAEQAMAMLECATPDLILMDIALPGMDGLSLTRKLKADSALPPRTRGGPDGLRNEGRRGEGAGCGLPGIYHQADRYAAFCQPDTGLMCRRPGFRQRSQSHPHRR